MMRADYTEGPLVRYWMSLLYSVTRLLFLFLKDRHIGTITGLENLPQKGPVIVVANHLSYMDNFLLAYVFDRHYGEKLYVPTNVKAFSWFFKSFWHLSSGAVPIDPKKPEEAYGTLQQLLSDGKSILLFPEGTRSDGTQLLPFKFGAFNLARNTGTSIVPCALIDTHKVLPKNRLRFVKGQRASVAILPVIDAGSLACDDVADIKASCRASIAHVALAQRPSPVLSGRSAAHLARKAANVVEGLIEDGVETMASEQLKPVLLWHELATFTQEDTHEVDVQYVRAVGFRLLTAPKVMAPFLIRPFLRLCEQIDCCVAATARWQYSHASIDSNDHNHFETHRRGARGGRRDRRPRHHGQEACHTEVLL
jgi:1-acyl-sn-glycerol-3-phosphate acyltransferase